MLLADFFSQNRPDHLTLSFNMLPDIPIAGFPRFLDQSLLDFVSRGLSAVRLLKNGKPLGAKDVSLAIRRLPLLNGANILVM